MKILIYNNSPQIGDNIRLFNLINTLNSSIHNCDLWYLGSDDYDLFSGPLKAYNLCIHRMPQSTHPGGYNLSPWRLYFRKGKSKYPKTPFDLVINMGSDLKESLMVRQIPTKFYYSAATCFIFCSRYRYYRKHKTDPTIIVKNIEKMLNLSIPIKPYNIRKIDSTLYKEAKRLLPGDRYIGFAVTKASVTRKKWPLERFINIANEVSFRGYNPVFLIERKHQATIDRIKKEVPNAVFPELDSSMACPALVTALTTRLLAAVSLNCGIMHMMGLANIPMVVLFGKTDPKKFAPRIDQIQILDSKALHNTDNIESISENEVMYALDQLRAKPEDAPTSKEAVTTRQ